MVHKPGRPELRAISKSKLSASLTSPTTIRPGRIRSASFTNRRKDISPTPSRFGCRVCMATQSAFSIRISKVSSTVTTRWSLATSFSNAQSKVVLPACVAPETSRFFPAVTASERKAACIALIDSNSTRSERE